MNLMLMFWVWGASVFNPKDLVHRDMSVSVVTDMSWMLSYASAFDGNISSFGTHLW
jgi:hypothetical protein